MDEVLRYGRMMFIYDTTCCTREEDDPAEAICFLRCGGGGGDVVQDLSGEVDADGAAIVDSAALHLVCQLMGTAFFTEKDMATFPRLIRLRHGQFVLHRESNFVWVMHTSGEDEPYVTRAQLTRTRQALRLLHGSLSALLAAAGGDRGVLRRRLARTLGPLLAAAGGQPPLERVLDVVPRLDWAQKDDFIAQQLSDVQSAALRLPGVLSCTLCWDAKVVSNDDIEEVLEALVHIHRLPGDAFDLADVDFVMPPGTLLARVHLGGALATGLRAGAEKRWVQSEEFPPSSSPSDLPPLVAIDEATEGTGGGSGAASVTSSAQEGGADARPGKENRPDAVRRRRRRRRQSPDKRPVPAGSPEAAAPSGPAEPDPMESESPAAVRHRISALALQALSAECARAEPPPPPALDEIPVRQLRRRSRASRRPRRSLTELDVPEPFSNLAYLKRRQPDLYRDEVRKLQASLPDNQPAFTAVSANPYSFGIPRSNRLYTPRLAVAEPAGVAPPPSPSARGPPWRPVRGAPAGYFSESSRPAGSPRGRPVGRRFYSDGEELSWRPRQLAAQLPDGGTPQLPADEPLVAALLYTHAIGKLRCHVLLEPPRGAALRGTVQHLNHVTGAGLLELETMLRSYRSIPSFHGQHYSYVSVRERPAAGGDGSAAPAAGPGRQLESEGATRLDSHLVQMVHADLLAGRLADCRIRTPSDVLLAQRSGSTETYYQQRTSGLQTGLPVVNGPLSRVDDRARKRLSKNHGLMLG
ncbi:uncharacterized protein LOC122380075 [Amphibalanus amphitrite]|uniref:uncharacterized protein LOC122380075 n=1 Tax=Amphibalanus amphitrite TaxID=1232801 RepID=UPI001C916224|nr:uncharacterized protein LOC122380075 [Amphibalanus amphitrite]